MDILFKNADIITGTDDLFLIKNGFLGVENDKIVYISQHEPKIRAKREIDATNKVLMPGLVNSHTHLPMSVLRTIAEDLELKTWLFDHIFKAEAKLDEKCIEVGTTLTIAEMLRTGTTSITDMYFKLPTIVDVVDKIGLRANLCNASMCFDSTYDKDKDNAYKEFCEVFEKYHNKDNGRIKIDVGIHGEYTSNSETWTFWSDMAKKHNLNMHLHLSETKSEHEECKERHNGQTPAQILASHGVFDTRATLAHCVHLEDKDLEILATKNVTVAHNPVSNLKLASGIAPISKYREYGINIALGTDGVASNNTHDLFEEIKISAILSKGITQNAKATVAKQAITMATKNGAIGQGRDDIGTLEVDKKADIIMVDFDNLHHTPNHDTIGGIVYNTTGQDVVLTMVDGKILYENGKFNTIDLKKVIHELENYVLPRIKD